MRPHRPIVLASLALAASFALAIAVAPARAQLCTPGACSAVFHFVSFESFAPGTSVEGLGAVDPALNITSVAWTLGPSCPVGSASVIETGNLIPFSSYSTATFVNGCLDGIHGFGDTGGCVLDYDFTFAAGSTVNCFALKMVDFGDYYPFGGTSHGVRLTAYDASNTVVDMDQLLAGGGVDSLSGDACLSQAGAPGNYVLSVSGGGIVRVELRFNGFPDPNVGFDDITFCEIVGATPTRPRSWGVLKARYR